MSEQEHKPQRMTISRALEMALVRNAGPRNEVHLNAGKDGEVTSRITVTHDDLNEAESLAYAAMDRARERYPAAPSNGPALKVKLTRNAKGETQIEVDGEGPAVEAEYERLRAKYPLADGTVSHDAPRATITRAK